MPKFKAIFGRAVTVRWVYQAIAEGAQLEGGPRGLRCLLTNEFVNWQLAPALYLASAFFLPDPCTLNLAIASQPTTPVSLLPMPLYLGSRSSAGLPLVPTRAETSDWNNSITKSFETHSPPLLSTLFKRKL